MLYKRHLEDHQGYFMAFQGLHVYNCYSIFTGQMHFNAQLNSVEAVMAKHQTHNGNATMEVTNNYSHTKLGGTNMKLEVLEPSY